MNSTRSRRTAYESFAGDNRVMRNVLFASFLVLFLGLNVAAQSVKVEVDGGKSLELKAGDLGKFERHDLTATAHDGRASKYSGYALRDLLLLAGAKIGKDQLRGKEIAAYVIIEGSDGYKAVFSITEFSEEFSDRAILFADRWDGTALSAKEGPFQIIVPDDKKHGRWVRNVIAIKLRKVE